MKPKPDWVKEPVFAVGDHVWLYPDKVKPTLRRRGLVTKVHLFGAWGQTQLYNTDIEWKGSLAVSLNAHWLKPVDALILLAEVEHARDQAPREPVQLPASAPSDP